MILHSFSKTSPRRVRGPGAALLLAALLLASAPASAGESLWAGSYRLEAEGRLAEALGMLDPVPVNGPDAELRCLRRAWLLYLLGGHHESIREYRLAIERNGSSLDARLGLLLPLLALERWDEAQREARTILDKAPHNYLALLRLAVAQTGQKEWSGVVQSAQSLIAAFPSDAMGFLYLARARTGLGQKREATEAYRAVLVRQPDQAEAKAALEQP
ncbi:MAG: hypothetical protein HQL99_07265 [Magnetococcales bacterium]|nr:hypothetical protein [Magnetococcales bacterium]